MMSLRDRGEGAGAVEREPWDAELPGDVTGPRVYHVGDDAARRRPLLPEPRRERLPERAAGQEEVAEEVFGREHVDVLAAVRQAELGGREGELHQLHRQAGLLHAGGEPGHPGGVDRRDDEADPRRAVLGQQARHVGHGDGVALRHHRDQHEVRRRRRRVAAGG
ncbi:Os01g0176050, partial [Oryza sativa Japonica Group]